MDAFAAYGHALVSVALSVLIWVVLSPLSAVKKGGHGLAPGGVPAQDYNSSAYRWHRAYMNLTEILGPFAAATLAAVLAGASPFWVNVLASIFFVTRLVMAVVHIRGIGKPSGGLRSILFTLGWASTLILSVLAIVAVF